MMRCPSAGLFCVFCDEKYLNLDGKHQVLISCVAMPQGPWNSLPPANQSLEEPRRISRLDRIERLLEQTDGAASAAIAELAPEMIPKGERDGTADLPDMSRADNVWGTSMAFCLAALFPWLHILGLQVQTADVYYDNRDLKYEHVLKMEQLVTELLPRVIRTISKAIETTPEARPTIRRFQKITKVAEGREPDRLQAGITVAHYLLQNWMQLKKQPRPRIDMRDNTNQVVNYIRKFQKS